jgi:hypothetical protein
MFHVGIGAAVVTWEECIYLSWGNSKAHPFTAPAYSCICVPCEQYSLSLYKLKFLSMTFDLLCHCLKHRASYFDWKNEQFFSFLSFLPSTAPQKCLENNYYLESGIAPSVTVTMLQTGQLGNYGVIYDGQKYFSSPQHTRLAVGPAQPCAH